MSRSTFKIIMIMLVGFFIHSYAFAATRLMYENFDDRALAPGLVVFGGNWARLSPPQYNLNAVGRSGSGYSFTSGTVSEAYICWYSGLPNPWPSDEMYVSFWMRYPTFTSTDSMENFKLFYPHWNGTNSYVHYSVAGRDSVYYSARGNGEMVSASNWITCPGQTDGRWHHYEFYVKFSEGISRFWYDGALKLNHRYGANVWVPNNVYYISAPSIDAEESGVFSRQIDDWEVWDGMPGTTTNPPPTPTPSASVSQPAKLSMVTWTGTSQTGDSTWSDSTAAWCVRALVDRDAIQASGNNVLLGFQGRTSGNYTIRKVSIAERDPNGEEGDIVDSTWKRITFDNRTEGTWSSDSITIPAGQIKRSNAIPFVLDRNKDYYVTFMIETPGTYLTAPSDYGQLYFNGVDHTDDLDWSSNGCSFYAGRLHGLTSISVTQ